MLEIIKPAIIRAVVYFLPLVLGAIAAWLVAQGFGTYDEAAGTYTFTVQFDVLVTYVVAFIGAPGVALAAVLRGWKPLS